MAYQQVKALRQRLSKRKEDHKKKERIFKMSMEMKEVSLEEMNETAGGAGSNKVVYTVVRGDNLSKIAKRYGVTVKQLVEWNNIADPNLIFPGQKIILYV
jgi:LysM repeat protein